MALLSRALKFIAETEPGNVRTVYASPDILTSLKNVVQFIANRQNTLRAVNQALSGTEAKILKMAGEDWRKSKFFPLIASLRCNKMDVNQHITEGLLLSKRLSHLGSELNSVEDMSSEGTRVVLTGQRNYIPLSNTNQTVDGPNPRNVKQGSDAWHALRRKAKVTGSTCNRAVGLGKFKEQVAHYDNVFFGKPGRQFTETEQQAMKYGKEHEIDAIATLCNTVLPFHFPNLLYVEEGCMPIGHDDDNTFMIVSPDGSLRTTLESKPNFMFETKCKSPVGYVSHSYYSIPKYYVPQILAEMASYSCEKLIFTCWSQESTTVFLVTFDKELWNLIWNELIVLYGSKTHVRPKKASPQLLQIQQHIDRFCESNTELLAEYPSSTSVQLNQDETTMPRNHNEQPVTPCQQTSILDRIEEILNEGKKWISTAYHLSRTVATEILVYMVRRFHMEKNNSHIVAYAMKGSSMRAETFRSMLHDVIQACETAGLKVLVTSSDGQWHRFSIRDDDDKPLTVHQLHKDHWNCVRKKSLPNLKSYLFNICQVSPGELCISHEAGSGKVVENAICTSRIGFSKKDLFLPLYSDPTDELINQVSELVVTQENDLPSVTKDTLDECKGYEDAAARGLDFLYMAEDNILHDRMSSSTSNSVDRSETNVTERAPQIDDITEAINAAVSMLSHTNIDVVAHQDPFPVSNEDLNAETPQELPTPSDKHQMNMSRALGKIKTNLKANKSRKSSLWDNISIEDFTKCFSSTEQMDKSFTKPELCICLSSLKEEEPSNTVVWRKSWKKGELVDALWASFQGTPLVRRSGKKTSPPNLRKLCMKAFEKLHKTEFAIIAASLSWPETLMNSGGYPACNSIAGITDCINWFSKPNMTEKDLRFHFTDACHILTCLRTKLCTTGISGLSIDAWTEAALSQTTSLNIAVITDCVDKQSVSIARRVFALEVQHHMENAGRFHREANFCKLVREWFDSVDEPKLGATERVRRRLALRDWLISGYNVGQFPPHTKYVKGIPIVTFEALVTHIERSIQLYPMVQTSYNARALGTQEMEQFFSTFRDMDPSGSGTPKPDAIPGMLRATVELDNFRLNPDRWVH